LLRAQAPGDASGARTLNSRSDATLVFELWDKLCLKLKSRRGPAAFAVGTGASRGAEV
jgi:hypothetical protein